jgi:hypothetical protein
MDATTSVGLRLPVQAAVNRTASYGALADGTGVDASLNLGDIFKTLGPIVSNLPWGDIASTVGGFLGL